MYDVFLAELVTEAKAMVWDRTKPVFQQSPIGRLRFAAMEGAPPPAADAAWWRGLETRLTAKFPDVDARMLDLFRHREELPDRTSPWMIISYWLETHPTPAAIDAVLTEMEAAVTGGVRVSTAPGVIELAAAIEPAPRPRCAAAMRRSLQLRFEPALTLADALIQHLGESEPEVSLAEQLLVELPRKRYSGMGETRRIGALPLAMTRVIDRALADEVPALNGTLAWYVGYQGMDHFLGACRQLSRYAKLKPPLNSSFESFKDQPLSWPVLLLRRILPPSAADRARAPELAAAAVPPATLLTAVLYAPHWAYVAEEALDWPGLGELLRWLQYVGETGHWKAHRSYRHEYEPPAMEEGEGVDPAPALAAVARMGEERLTRLMKHPVAKSIYKDGFFLLQAARGANAADVEAGFIKRDKLSVQALGLLPDEGDILQRYLALRRFAQEARQFGALRQASEQKVVEQALANLTITAGYAETGELEWAMEAQLAAESDPTARRWEIAGYTVWIEPDAKATLVVANEGKRLKSVPPAVREAPEYEEIKENREQMKAQWGRVRRRLELAMARGEIMDRKSFGPALATPAGRAMLPLLVLRCWPAGVAEPVEVLDYRTLPGEIERYQIVHTLEMDPQWQSMKVEQPFEQIGRAVYARRPGEAREIRRFAGRKVRIGTLVERLKRMGWRPGPNGELLRRLPGRAEAALWLQDGVVFEPGMEVRTVGELSLPAEISPLLFSEVLREVDLATAQGVEV